MWDTYEKKNWVKKRYDLQISDSFRDTQLSKFRKLFNIFIRNLPRNHQNWSNIVKRMRQFVIFGDELLLPQHLSLARLPPTSNPTPLPPSWHTTFRARSECMPRTHANIGFGFQRGTVIRKMSLLLEFSA